MTDCDTPCTICYIFHHILDDINWLEAYVPVLRAVLCTRHIRKVSTIRLFKKKDLFSKNYFFIRYAIPYTTFLHSFHYY
jgi:hypothetical protein